MAKGILIGVLLLAVAILAGRVLFSSPTPDEPPIEQRPAASRPLSGGLKPAGGRPSGGGFHAELDRPADRPNTNEREPEPRRPRMPDEPAVARPHANERPADAEPPAADRPAVDDSGADSQVVVADAPKPSGAKQPLQFDDSVDPIERALMTGGLTPDVAADIKQRYENLEGEERSLRVDAAAEGWLDSPEFDQELDAIETERVALRDEIGDTAYDHYLFAKGQPNRIFVSAVLGGAAEQAGLQSGDVIIRYGDQRIFSPDDLIGATSAGNPGEVVRVEIRRQDDRLKLEVPAGPLDVQVGGTQDPPEGD